MSNPPGVLIFVVDDELSIASSLALILKSQGYRVQFFTDPVKALEAASSETPDLLITDAIMPVLSGVELAIRMKVLCPGFKVLLLSGQIPNTDQLAQARTMGVDIEVLNKPAHPSVLLEKVRTLQRAFPGKD